MKLPLRIALLASLLSTPLAMAQPQAAGDGLFPMDPVALIAGKPVEGRRDLETERAGYRYRFASPENLQRFLEAPAQYEIQLGGACARMGALSARGSVERYSVVGGRIYLFASDACREGFLRRPEALLYSPDPAPPPDATAEALGAQRLERLVEALGGADLLDELPSLVVEQRWTEVLGEQQYERVERMTYALPMQVGLLRMARENGWNATTWRLALSGDSGWFAGRDPRTMIPVQVAEFRQEYLHEPLVLACLRDQLGFSVRGESAPAEAPQTLDWLRVRCAGVETWIGLDPETGLPVETRYRGRGQNSAYSPIVHQDGPFLVVDGLSVPTQRRVLEAGQSDLEGGRPFTRFGPVAELDTDLFMP